MMNYKPVQLFHPSSYQATQHAVGQDDSDSKPSQQQLQTQLLQYQPFEVKHRKRTSKHQFNVRDSWLCGCEILC